MNYEQAIKTITELTKFGINLGLVRITGLLTYLGNPHAYMPVIHIGGTNGKGSTSAMIASVLTEAGYRVGVYSSPHLISYTERFTINGEAIFEDEFAAILAAIIPAFCDVLTKTGENPTEFEVLTAMAFLYFRRQNVDILILEVGLGGDIDSTNVIEKPLLSIITNVSIEHTKYLGDTIAEIAAKKSGIIKGNCPVITASTDLEALSVIRQAALAKAAPFYHVQEEVFWEFQEENASGQVFRAGLSHEGIVENTRNESGKDLGEIRLALRGEHQLVNAATAILALKLLNAQGWKVSNDSIKRGLATAKWPGRLEILRTNPLVVVDGAHNPAGIAALSGWLSRKRQEVKKVILVIGMLEDKDRACAVSLIEPFADNVIVTKPASTRAGDWRKTGEYFQKKATLDYCETLGAALNRAFMLAEPDDLILITGSLYLVGEVYGILTAVEEF